MNWLDRIEGPYRTQKKWFYLHITMALAAITTAASIAAVWCDLRPSLLFSAAWVITGVSLLKLMNNPPLFGVVYLDAYLYSPSARAVMRIERPVRAGMLDDLGGFLPDAMLIILASEMPQATIADDWRWATDEQVAQFHTIAATLGAGGRD